MDILRWQGGVGAVDQALATGIRDLHPVQTGSGSFVITSTGGAGGLISYRVQEGAAPVERDRAYAPYGAGAGLSGALSEITLAGQRYIVTGAEASGRLVGYALEDNGTLGTRQVLDGPGALAAGTNGQVWLAGSDDVGGYIRSFRPDGQGGFDATTLTRDGADRYLDDPVALETVRLGGVDYVITLSGSEPGVSVFAADAGTGALSLTGAMGQGEGLGLLSAPRFGAVQSLSVVQNDAWTYVLAAGGAGDDIVQDGAGRDTLEGVPRAAFDPDDIVFL